MALCPSSEQDWGEPVAVFRVRTDGYDSALSKSESLLAWIELKDQIQHPRRGPGWLPRSGCNLENE